MHQAFVAVHVHPSQFPDRVRSERIESLRLRQIHPKFLYESAKQVQAWIRLHEAHSPARRDRDCRETYLRAFADVAQQLESRAIQIIGLGCGTADKECRLIERLPEAADRVSFVAVDVSIPLVLIARDRVVRLLPADRCHPVVCDLGAAPDLAAHLPALASHGTQRLFTCFGVVPNFRPRQIFPRLATLLSPGDRLLLGVNLAPGADYRAAVTAIRPQYDNALTRDWLRLLLDDLGIDPGDGRIQFVIEPDPAWDPLARIAAHFHFDRPRCVVLDNEEFRFARDDTLELFFSYRHSPGSIRGLLEPHGIRVDAHWSTASGEEGIFLCGA